MKLASSESNLPKTHQLMPVIYMRFPGSKYLFLVSFCFLLSDCTRKTNNALYLLPDNFQGNVIILFNQLGGANPEYLDGFRVYRIPHSGVLKTKFESGHGNYAIAKYCYASQFKNIKENTGCILNYDVLKILTKRDSAKIKNMSTTVFCFRHPSFGQDRMKGELFTISTIAKSDSIYQLGEALIEQMYIPK